MDVNEIRKWHSAFKRIGELFEIRILGDRTWSGYFYDVENAIKALEAFDNYNIYYSINEVKSACASRAQFNCFRQVKGTATSKQDIEHRWWLPIDVDCERPSGVSSTNEEKEKAHKKAQDVFAFLRDRGFSSPIVCDSSSGYHIIYPIDMDNTQESEDTIKAFLEILEHKFTDESVKIDTVLYDANRILRLPGTFGRKGRSSDERPHRLAKILSVPNNLERMKRSKIVEFNETFSIKIEQPQRRTFNHLGGNHEQFNLHNFIAKHGIKIAKEIPLGRGGTKFILEECPFDAQHKAPDSALFEMPNGSIAFKCFHNSCSQYDWRAFRLHYDPHAYDYENEAVTVGQQYRQVAYPLRERQKNTYQIKEELPELGEKWLSLSSIEKIDLTNLEKVKTGFHELDKKIGGLYMSEVTILSGSNSSGKSSWLNSLLLNIVQQNYKIALWSGELRADILKTWIQMVAAGPRNLARSQFDEGRYYVPDNVGKRIDKWLDGKFFLYNNGYGTKAEQILHDMNVLLKVNVKVFALDNMMSLDVDLFDGDKNSKQKELILRIKDFAMKNMVHVILVAHPRKVTTFLRKTDISGTADITNAVDNVVILHRTNEDFLHAISDFYTPAIANQYRQFGNVLSVEKNRLMGVVDYMCGFHYDIISRRFKNAPEEIVVYNWEKEPTSISLDLIQQNLPSNVNLIETHANTPKYNEDIVFMPPDGTEVPF